MVAPSLAAIVNEEAKGRSEPVILGVVPVVLREIKRVVRRNELRLIVPLVAREVPARPLI
jgi:hypothetical protein